MSARSKNCKERNSQKSTYWPVAPKYFCSVQPAAHLSSVKDESVLDRLNVTNPVVEEKHPRYAKASMALGLLFAAAAAAACPAASAWARLDAAIADKREDTVAPSPLAAVAPCC